MGFEETRDLHGRFFAAARWARNDGGFRHVRCHREAHAAEELDALGNVVDQGVLFFVVLIKEKMKLVEGVANDLPVVLLVEVAKGDGVGEDLIEIFDAGSADVFVKRDGELGDFAVRLNLAGMLMKNGAGALGAGLRIAR